MKKLYVYILLYMLLCISPIVCAELKVSYIKIYVENERDFDDEDSGGDIEVIAGDDIELLVRLENDMDNTTKAKLKAVIKGIDDNDDITKEIGWFDIGDNEEESRTLDFDIPSDAKRDDYDFELKIYYEYDNDTDGELKYNWDIIVEEESKEDKNDTIIEGLNELKDIVKGINCSEDDTSDYYSFYISCFKNLTECREQSKSEGNSYSLLQSCESAKENLQKENLQSDGEYFALNTTYNSCTTDRDNFKSQRIIFSVVFLALGFFVSWLFLVYFKDKKKLGKFSTSKEISPDVETINPDDVKQKTPPRGESMMINPDDVKGA